MPRTKRAAEVSEDLREAFFKVCKDAKPAQGFYVCLMERRPFYGGPEEGGWWGADNLVVAYQYFSTEEAAEAARVEVEKLAAERTREERRAFGRQCLAECEWLDARGLDADFLPEVDGESEFYVLVQEGIPQDSYGSRGYE